jgi:hypothetical protein
MYSKTSPCASARVSQRLIVPQLDLHRREEALRHGIVQAVSAPAHAADDTVGRQRVPVVGAGLLATLIRVMEQALGRASPPQGHGQGLHREVCRVPSDQRCSHVGSRGDLSLRLDGRTGRASLSARRGNRVEELKGEEEDIDLADGAVAKSRKLLMTTYTTPSSHLQRGERAALKWQRSKAQGKRTFKRSDCFCEAKTRRKGAPKGGLGVSLK